MARASVLLVLCWSLTVVESSRKHSLLVAPSLHEAHAQHEQHGRDGQDVQGEAIASAICSDTWAPAALALAGSIVDQVKAGQHHRQLLLMIPDTYHPIPAVRSALERSGWQLLPFPLLKKHPNVQRAGADCLTLQLRTWDLESHGYSKVLFMDADTVAVNPLDDIFKHDDLAATAEPSEKTEFQGGLFLARPNSTKFARMAAVLASPPDMFSTNMGMERMLNTMLNPTYESFQPRYHTLFGHLQWQVLPIQFNRYARDLSPGAIADNFHVDKKDAIVIHFAGGWGRDQAEKPWNTGSNSIGQVMGMYGATKKRDLWRDIYARQMQRLGLPRAQFLDGKVSS